MRFNSIARGILKIVISVISNFGLNLQLGIDFGYLILTNIEAIIIFSEEEGII